MVKMIAQSASRTLGLLIAKDKALGGMPYQCFSKCYDAIVQSTLNYGAPIYGTSAFSCIDAVQNRACRYFLGLGKYAPNTAINGDMGWPMPQQRQWICVIRHWCKLTNMNNTLLTKRIFTACSQMASSRCKTWFYRVGQLFVSIDHAYLLGAENVNTRSVLLSIEAELKVISDIAWKEKLNANSAIRGNAQGGNKLRTYSQFKHEYGTEPYVTVITRKCYRSAYAKFRCGVAPIKIETCRYGLNRVPVEQRLCDECNLIEDEFHVIMVCTRYIDIRTDAMNAISLIDYQFSTYTPHAQFIQMMSNPLLYKIVSKVLFCILNKRRHIHFH